MAPRRYKKTFRVEIIEVITYRDPSLAPVERKISMQEINGEQLREMQQALFGIKP